MKIDGYLNYLRHCLIFTHQGRNITIRPLKGYGELTCFLIFGDGIICVFKPSVDAVDEQKRRNVFKFSFNGEVLWQICDKYQLLENKDLITQNSIKFEKENGIDTVFFNKENEVLVSDVQGTQYHVNINTGELKRLKPKGRPW